MITEWQEELDKLALLGDPTAEFTVSGGVLLRRLAVALLFMLGGIGWLVVAYFVPVLRNVHFLILAVFFALMGIMLVVRTYLNLGGRVLVYPEGVIHLRRDRVNSFFWDEVARFSFLKTSGHWSRIWQGSYAIYLQLAGGKDIHFDDSLPRLKELAQIIQKETIPHLWPPARASFETGESIWFGSLQVNQKGLSRGKEFLAWENIGVFALNDQEITIRQKGKAKHWYHTTISETPNFHLLRQLMNYVIATKQLKMAVP